MTPHPSPIFCEARHENHSSICFGRGKVPKDSGKIQEGRTDESQVVPGVKQIENIF